MARSNEQVIKDAFSRLKAEKDEIIRAGMYGLLEDAVHHALDAHNERHQSHIMMGDTYGWMLVHNGEIEEISTVATEENIGKASRQLEQMASKVSKNGWVGVVMAGLEPASYFSVVYELGMLHYAFQMTRQNFFEYFNEI